MTGVTWRTGRTNCDLSETCYRMITEVGTVAMTATPVLISTGVVFYHRYTQAPGGETTDDRGRSSPLRFVFWQLPSRKGLEMSPAHDQNF